jgi:hypothetical protein
MGSCIDAGTGHHAHETKGSSAENQAETFARHGDPERLRRSDEFWIVTDARSAEDAD